MKAKRRKRGKKTRPKKTRPKKHEIIGEWVLHNLFFRRGSWCGRIRNRSTGALRLMATRETDERKAHQKVINWVRKLEEEDAARKAGAVVPTARAFEATYREYLDLVKTDIRPVTRTAYELDLDLYARSFDGKLLAEITLAEVEKLLADLKAKGRSARTRSKHVSALRGFFGWCRRHRYVAEDPTLGIKVRVRREGRKEGIALTMEEARTLLEACRGSNIVEATGRYGKYKAEFHRPAWLFVAVLLGLHSGLRRRGIFGLEWRHVDLGSGWITLPGTLMKRGGAHRIPIHVELKETLEALLRGRRNVPREEKVIGVERTGTSDVLEDVAKRLDLLTPEGRPIAWHTLRRSFATWYSLRVPYPVLKKLLAHADENVTDLYPKVPPSELEKAVREFPRLLGPVEEATRKVE